MTGKDPAGLESEIASLRQELESCKRQLMEAYQLTAVGHLLAGIVHEINTPIGSILSNNEVRMRTLEILKQLMEKSDREESPPPPKAEKLLATLSSLAAVDKIACERITSVVHGLKMFLSGGRREFVEADLNQILDSTLKLAHCEFRRRITVETQFGGIPRIECEPNQLGQVFLNVLVNAAHAIEGEGKVVIRTERDGDGVRVSISDSGSGIPPENRPKIFSPGFTTKPAGVGTGLGLSISRDIVKDHGGEISFESEVGKGTTFYIRIPVSRHGQG